MIHIVNVYKADLRLNSGFYSIWILNLYFPEIKTYYIHLV